MHSFYSVQKVVSRRDRSAILEAPTLVKAQAQGQIYLCSSQTYRGAKTLDEPSLFNCLIFFFLELLGKIFFPCSELVTIEGRHSTQEGMQQKNSEQTAQRTGGVTISGGI